MTATPTAPTHPPTTPPTKPPATHATTAPPSIPPMLPKTGDTVTGLVIFLIVGLMFAGFYRYVMHRARGNGGSH
jgi:LPXTG-motif cell wall-anchored protein